MTDYKLLKKILINRFNDHVDELTDKFKEILISNDTIRLIRYKCYEQKYKIILDSFDFFDEDNVKSVDLMVEYIYERIRKIIEDSINNGA